MAILARGGATYVRLRFHVGPGGELTIPVNIDWHAPFAASDQSAWDAEYQTCVRSPALLLPEPLDPEQFFADDWPWGEWGLREDELQHLPGKEELDAYEL